MSIKDCPHCNLCEKTGTDCLYKDQGANASAAESTAATGERGSLQFTSGAALRKGSFPLTLVGFGVGEHEATVPA